MKDYDNKWSDFVGLNPNEMEMQTMEETVQSDGKTHEILSITKVDVIGDLRLNGYNFDISEQDMKDIVFELQLSIDEVIDGIFSGVMKKFVRRKMGEDG
jgi:hypothetical protein